MDNKETKENSNQIVIDIITRQTNYSKETATEKLIQHKNNILSIIREYMSENKKENEENVSNTKSTSQLIYGEIRNMMGNASANYRRNKEIEEYRQQKQQAQQQAQQQQAQQQQAQQNSNKLELIPE